MAAGQRIKERDELVYSVTASQLTSWLLVLSALLIAMALSVRRALAPLPLNGDVNLLNVLLRNLLDNAVRYAPAGSLVTLRVLPDRLEVDNDGEPVPAAPIARMGERFYRPEGQQECGSGLGVSIVQVTLRPIGRPAPPAAPVRKPDGSAALAGVSGP